MNFINEIFAYLFEHSTDSRFLGFLIVIGMLAVLLKSITTLCNLKVRKEIIEHNKKLGVAMSFRVSWLELRIEAIDRNKVESQDNNKVKTGEGTKE